MPICPLCHGNHDIAACPRWRVPTVTALCSVMMTMCAPVPAVTMDGTLNDDDRATLKTCTADNPCAVWSQNEIKALLVIYRQKLIEANVTCRRDSV